MSKQIDSTPWAGSPDRVQGFYDRYPYPRPVDSLEKYRRRWRERARRRADFFLFWPVKPYREDRTILMAGCGTSQAAKHALRWPGAQVTGIDFSTTSVRHAVIQREQPRVIAVDCGAVPDIEYTALKQLIDLEERLSEAGIMLWLVALNPEPLRTIQRSSLGEALGHERMHPNLQQAVLAYLAERG